jgi:hypothetical protein
LGGRKDEAWSTYLDFLYPRPTDHQRMMDRRVCEQLEAKGDDLDAEREIDHRVYFTEKSNLKRYQNYLNSEGFLDFKHWGAPRQVSDVVYDLYTKAVELGGDYDGWGCSVTKAAPES